MSNVSVLARALVERRVPLGGWSHLSSPQTSVEATSLAAMALVAEPSDTSGSAIDALLSLQRRDGGWPAFLGDSEASWTTALVLSTLNGTNDFVSARERAFHWLIAERGLEAHWLSCPQQFQMQENPRPAVPVALMCANQ